MDALAKILAAALVELLRYFQARQDIQELVRKEIEAAGLKDANEALGWKAAAVGAPDGGATIRVRDGALSITLPGRDPNTRSRATDPEMQPRTDGDSMPPVP